MTHPRLRLPLSSYAISHQQQVVVKEEEEIGGGGEENVRPRVALAFPDRNAGNAVNAGKC